MIFVILLAIRWVNQYLHQKNAEDVHVLLVKTQTSCNVPLLQCREWKFHKPPSLCLFLDHVLFMAKNWLAIDWHHASWTRLCLFSNVVRFQSFSCVKMWAIRFHFSFVPTRISSNLLIQLFFWCRFYCPVAWGDLWIGRKTHKPCLNSQWSEL